MNSQHSVEAPDTVPVVPQFRAAQWSDITASLRDGWADFKAYPVFGLAFGAVYTVSGLIILFIMTRIGAPWMTIPLAIGFPLIGPFVAVGLYEISRRREAGEAVSWAGVMAHVFRQRERQFSWMAFTVLFIFWVWIYQVRLLLALFLGFKSFSSLGAFMHIVGTTPEGWGFLMVGTLVGAALATILYSVTVISLPLLMDREVDFISAMIASVGTVLKAPVPMLAYGALIGVMTFMALVPAFLGLLVVLPLLGHTTWRLYHRLLMPS